MQHRESGSYEVTNVCGERTRAFVPLALGPVPAHSFGYAEHCPVSGSFLA